jgi:type 1 glutamine amidotransferase
VTRNLLLSGGPTHDFAATSDAVSRILDEQGIRTTVVLEPDAALELLDDSLQGRTEPFSLLTVNALRWSMGAPRFAHLRAGHAYRLTDHGAARLDEFVRGGGGLLALHTAVICFDAQVRWRELCGAAWDWTASSHPPCGPARVRVTEHGRGHPLTAGLDDFVIDDEVYGFLDEVDGLAALLTAEHGGRDHPLLWARELGAGRVVTDLLGHGPASFEHPVHRTILRRAVEWAIGGVR